MYFIFEISSGFTSLTLLTPLKPLASPHMGNITHAAFTINTVFDISMNEFTHPPCEKNAP